MDTADATFTVANLESDSYAYYVLAALGDSGAMIHLTLWQRTTLHMACSEASERQSLE